MTDVIYLVSSDTYARDGVGLDFFGVDDDSIERIVLRDLKNRIVEDLLVDIPNLKVTFKWFRRWDYMDRDNEDRWENDEYKLIRLTLAPATLPDVSSAKIDNMLL